MEKTRSLNKIRTRRQRAVRAKIFGEPGKPRISVFRSNRSLSVQLIDDEKGKTILSVSSRELSKEQQKKPKKEQATLLGALVAKKALDAGIKKAVFDRRSYRYHGRVESLADSIRKSGLTI